MAIIGAGFSGTMAAVQLARRGIDAMLIGRGPQMGRGAAYSTDDPAHLLNIPAAKMSAWPDRPDDFVAAIEAEGLGPEDYVQRMLFGRYLRGILDQSAVRLIEAEAVAVQQSGGWTVRLADDRSFRAKVLVNAAGPWVGDVIRDVAHLPSTERVRLVRGSHIIVPKLFDHAKSYFLQGQDGRIVFAIPYENDFTLIGTTDVDHTGPANAAVCATS